MILEKNGTPNILKEIIDENKSIIINMLNNQINDKIELSINKKKLICNLVIKFIFDIKNKYTSDINFLGSIKSNFNDCVINIYLPLNPNIEDTLRIISHELLHLYELYQIKNIFDKTKWKNTEALNDLDKMNIMKYSSIKYFRDMFYLSLPHEINARITSLHFYLMTLHSKDKTILMNNLQNTLEWTYFIRLRDFNVKELYDSILNEMDIDYAVNVFNFFNSIMKINFIINNEKDLFNYLDKTKMYYAKLAEYYRRKILKILNEVINDSVDSGLNYNKYLLSFEELTFSKPIKEKEINYINFY
jgi:hypothetical protein